MMVLPGGRVHGQITLNKPQKNAENNWGRKMKKKWLPILTIGRRKLVNNTTFLKIKKNFKQSIQNYTVFLSQIFLIMVKICWSWLEFNC